MVVGLGGGGYGFRHVFFNGCRVGLSSEPPETDECADFGKGFFEGR